jgi:hypothetical protein
MILKKHIIFLLLLAIAMMSNSAVAQLYVKGNNYIYNTNQVVYVKKEIELNAANSMFYLRKEGQLLQGTTGAGANKGLGKLSVFQEGTVNNFAYNYWCSPVGNVATATAVNNPFGITQLGVPTTTIATTTVTILPRNNYNGTSGTGALSIAQYWIWKFSVKNAYANWSFVGDSQTIAAGEGFTMKGVSGSDATTVDGVVNNTGSNQRYDFRGKPNDGTIDIPVAHDGTADGGQFTLTGNPYPSAIDLTLFLTDATNSTGIAYFWEQDKTKNTHVLADYVGGYGAFSPVSRGGSGIYVPAVFSKFDSAGNYVVPSPPIPPGLGYERRFSPVGQGFMIEGNTTGIVQMKNSYRIYKKEGAANLSQFAKTKNPSKTNKTTNTEVTPLPIPQIRFKTTLEKGLVLPMVLAFEPTATDKADFAMDAKSYYEDLDQEIFFDINELPYIIDVVAFDENKKIPLGLRNTQEAKYEIAIDEIRNFDSSQNIYIHDKETDVYHDLKTTAFNVTMPAGTNNSRFEITFISINKDKTALGVADNSIEKFYVAQNNSTQNLTIGNPKMVELKEIRIFDVSGKLIFVKAKLGSEQSYSFSTSGWTKGVYIVNFMTTDNQSESKKIIVSNSN